MPEKRTIERARAAKREGKAPATQAGEFVREEIHHVREGKHGVQSPKQAIAIGLSKARRAGVPIPPKKGASPEAREKAEREERRGRAPSRRRPSPKRSAAAKRAREREGTSAASTEELSKQGRRAARARAPSERSSAAKKAARTKGPTARKAAARRAAATRSKAAPPRPRSTRKAAAR
jgi:Family of unknown function (DUF6496)